MTSENEINSTRPDLCCSTESKYHDKHKPFEGSISSSSQIACVSKLFAMSSERKVNGNANAKTVHKAKRKVSFFLFFETLVFCK